MRVRKNTTLSVVFPIYNSGDFIQDAINSIINQTFTDFECVLCDASDDGSSDFLEKIIQYDKRFLIIKQNKMSLGQALQEGIEAASAPVIARMDADDIALPQRFFIQMGVMRKRPELLALGSAIQYIDEHNRPGRIARQPAEKHIAEALQWGCPLVHPTVMFRRKAVLDAGGYRPFYEYWEDYDLWLRLSRRGILDNLPQVLLYYRMHGGNSVSVHALPGRHYALNAQAAHIIARRTGHDPLDAVDTLPDVNQTLAALPTGERRLLLGRVLACDAHFIGDEDEDAEGKLWLQEVHKALPDPQIRKILGMYHMRCAKRYIKRQPKRAMQHVLNAVTYSPKIVMQMCINITVQYCRAWFNRIGISKHCCGKLS